MGIGTMPYPHHLSMTSRRRIQSYCYTHDKNYTTVNGMAVGFITLQTYVAFYILI